MLKLLGVSLLGLSLVLGWYWQSYQKFVTTPVTFTQESIDFTIPSGSSVFSITKMLVSEGIIEDASLFSWMVKLDGQEANIKAGEYVIKSGLTPREILAIFIAGKVKQYAFTIVEGWSFKQLITAVGANLRLKHTLKSTPLAEVMTSLGFKGEHPEGRFLPDTYYFTAGSTDKLFLQRAYYAMEKTLQAQWSRRQANLPLKTPYEALILASIVEKETGVVRERKQISGVFIRRLEKKMRLQTDPTVIYGMGDTYEGNLRKKDLKKDTPYNTYRRKGLPPTPIAMPGEAAINAVLHPQDENFLYFVAKGDGSHYFSSTLSQHNKAVRKYQVRQRKKDYRSSPPAND